MPTIKSIAERISPVQPETPAETIFERFRNDSDALAIAVVEGERPVGLIERSVFLLAYAESPDRHGDLTARDCMDCEPPVADAGMSAKVFAEIILNSGPGALLRGFIVTRDGCYWGVGSAAALLRASGGDDASPRKEQEWMQGAARDRCAFMTAISHELRTPLNGVLAVAELLQRQPLAANAQAHVQTIVDSSETLLRILQDALDLSRAEAGQLDFNPEPVALRGLMDTLQAEWEPRATAQGAHLMVGYDGDTELAGEIDGRRLKQVFDNLIASALRHARTGVVEASLRARAKDGSVILEARVRDNGPGLQVAADEDVFSPTARNTDRASAAGLGLSICRHVVNGMGGRIWAETNHGRGATFAFDLSAPLAVIAAREDTNVAEITELGLQTQPHILIVDDNATNRVVAQALCEMFGCTSETAEDGQEAVEVVQNSRFDLILMDIKMPRMDGVAATRAIRALEGPASCVPIIALTANADPDDARRYLENGMAAVVEKPIKPERLRMAMNTALSEQPPVETLQTAGKTRRAG